MFFVKRDSNWNLSVLGCFTITPEWTFSGSPSHTERSQWFWVALRIFKRPAELPSQRFPSSLQPSWIYFLSRCAPRVDSVTTQLRCLHQGRTLRSLHDRPLSESNVLMASNTDPILPGHSEPSEARHLTLSRFRWPYLCQQTNRRSLRRPDWETGGLAGRHTEDKRSASARKPMSKTVQ